ncbi:MAG: hypothetical protein KAJ58_01170 [Candidatus Pacebacteria bacterium]|nr:hypothetical protein [Candidatus Paceibacterota bacterium]
MKDEKVREEPVAIYTKIGIIAMAGVFFGLILLYFVPETVDTLVPITIGILAVVGMTCFNLDIFDPSFSEEFQDSEDDSCE